MKRFQECNRIVKIWRYRWYLLIPFKFAYSYILINKIHNHYDFDLIWGMEKANAQIKMKWYHTNEEVKSNMYKFFRPSRRKDKITKMYE